MLFGGDVHAVGGAARPRRSVTSPATAYPVYRLVLIGVGLALALASMLVVERTRLGALVRATVADREMVEAMGVDSARCCSASSPRAPRWRRSPACSARQIYGARPGLDENVLLLALVVVVIGGLGSIRGALVGALLIGQVESLGRALLPEVAPFLLFGTMALVLLFRPRGLFGSPSRRERERADAASPEAPPTASAARHRAAAVGRRRPPCCCSRCPVRPRPARSARWGGSSTSRCSP